MLTPIQLDKARDELEKAVSRDMQSLNRLQKLVVSDLGRPTRIQARRATAVSLVGTDGGHNQTGVNPFLAQLMRVVDSSNRQYCLEVVSTSTSMEDLQQYHLQPDENNEPTPLRELMVALSVKDLKTLSPVFGLPPNERSNSWLQVYRQITEWAVLLKLMKTPYGSDTVFVWDGPLRTKVFPTEIFQEYVKLIKSAINDQLHRRNQRIYLVGITKHSKVLERFRLAMALEGVMRQSYPCYAQLTGDVIAEAIDWLEYLSPIERSTLSAREEFAVRAKRQMDRGIKDVFSAGQMFFVKFGSRPTDPVWAADIFETQVLEAPTIFGYLLEDAKDGFPIPLFPQCLQDAHANAALVDFDMELFSHEFGRSLRKSLGSRSDVVDELELQDADPAARRYG